MIKKLRRKFILISAISVFFVLAVTIAAINIANYIGVENTAQTALQAIVSEGPRQNLAPGGPREGDPANLRQEHYFVVSFRPDGSIQESDTRQMFVLSEQECKDLAQKVFQGEFRGGKYGDFRYTTSLKNDGLTYVGFVDMKERLDSCRNFLLVSSLVSLGAYGVLIALIVLASKIAFKSSEEAYKKQKRFITNASHELRTPIAVISADMDLLEMDHGKSEWSESIRDQLGRLTEMTNQLITLAKLEEEDPSKYPFADFSLHEVCLSAAESFAPLFKLQEVKFSYNFPTSITMHGNKSLIDELIRIFLDNSLKYTGGENKSSYFVANQTEKGHIELRFSNTIDKNDETDIKQIMDRFYRSPSNKKEGSGIGLSIAQEIIHLHKGKIEIDKTGSIISFLIRF